MIKLNRYKQAYDKRINEIKSFGFEDSNGSYIHFYRDDEDKNLVVINDKSFISTKLLIRCMACMDFVDAFRFFYKKILIDSKRRNKINWVVDADFDVFKRIIEKDRKMLLDEEA